MLAHHSYTTLQLVVDTHHILDHTQHNTEHLDNTQTSRQFSSRSKNNSITLFIVYSLSEEYTDTPSYTQHNKCKVEGKAWSGNFVWLSTLVAIPVQLFLLPAINFASRYKWIKEQVLVWNKIQNCTTLLQSNWYFDKTRKPEPITLVQTNSLTCLHWLKLILSLLG